jgi:hypothetical protein
MAIEGYVVDPNLDPKTLHMDCQGWRHIGQGHAREKCSSE